MSKLVLSPNERTRLLRAGTGGVEGGGPAVEVSPKTFAYTGNYSEFIVPAGVTAIQVDLYGAEGGPSSGLVAGSGGNGGRVKCDLTVVPLELLRVYVGGQPTGATTYSTGGFNGGADSGQSVNGVGGGGGGATDVRRSPYGLADRLVVAGGGGGCGGNDNKVNLGHGGTPTGAQGSVSDYGGAGGGGGGTASAGGAGGTGATAGLAGALGLGGQGSPGNSRAGGGGGGGRYGGGGGGASASGGTSGAGGGGGSGLSTGVNETLESGVRTGAGAATFVWPPPAPPAATPILRAMTSGRNTQPTLPAGTIAGDVGLLFVLYTGQDGTPNIDITVGGGAFSSQQIWTPPTAVFTRLFGWWDDYTGTPVAPTLSGGTQPGNYIWALLSFIGASTTAPVDVSSVTDATGSSLPMVAITTLGDNRYVLNLFGYRYSDDGINSFGDYTNPPILNYQDYTGVDTVLKIVTLNKATPAPAITAGQWACSGQPSMRAAVAIKGP